MFVLAASPGVGAAAVLSWRDGTTLHLTNDATTAPADGTVRRFASRVAAPAGAHEGAVQALPCPMPATLASTAAVASRAPVEAAPAPRVANRPIVIAPTIVVRAPATQVTVVTGGSSGFDGYGAWPFLPTGFIGHEHPQVPFLAGRRLVPHSHFFAHGRAGFFTPWGHFSEHGLLVPSVPSYY